MNKGSLRLRMFAGPNGSGKSTFKSIIRPELLGIFINPDEIEKEIRNFDFLDLDYYEIQNKRSLDLLKEAIPFTNRAYIFDNSTHEHIWLAEITDGHSLEMKTDLVPAWFKKALGSKFDIENKRSKKL
jgi:predicted ABC-type ATPase